MIAPLAKLIEWIANREYAKEAKALERPALRRLSPVSRRLFEEAESEARITAFNLLSLRPLIPRQSILLIEAEHDVLAEPTEELWHRWGQMA
jgi:hypothetical protein